MKKQMRVKQIQMLKRKMIVKLLKIKIKLFKLEKIKQKSKEKLAYLMMRRKMKMMKIMKIKFEKKKKDLNH